MNTAKKKRLASAGWKVGTAAEFLKLSPEESKLVELRLALGDCLRRHRTRRGLTQLEVAKRLGSSQSRVAKLEAGAQGVSLDLLFRALFTTGLSAVDVLKEIRPRKRSAA